MNALLTLQAAKKAIQNLDPLGADALLDKFESLRPLTMGDQAEIAKELVAIRELAVAALEGVAAAHSQLKLLLSHAQTLDTYDKSGVRRMQDMSVQVVRTF